MARNSAVWSAPWDQCWSVAWMTRTSMVLENDSDYATNTAHHCCGIKSHSDSGCNICFIRTFANKGLHGNVGQLTFSLTAIFQLWHSGRKPSIWTGLLQRATLLNESAVIFLQTSLFKEGYVIPSNQSLCKCVIPEWIIDREFPFHCIHILFSTRLYGPFKLDS